MQRPITVDVQRFSQRSPVKNTSLATKAVEFVGLLLIGVAMVSCGGGPDTPAIPRFLIAVDGNGSGANINVFPINATTGVLGTAVGGSPFDLGLTDSITLAVHPNGSFVYAADGIDGSIHAWIVNETTGVPAQIAGNVLNESGSFYENCCAPTHVITITPDGRFLYSANGDATVGAYRIDPDGSLAHIADLNLGACQTGAITANDSFVWVTDVCGSQGTGFRGPLSIWTLRIGASGALVHADHMAVPGAYAWLWSIQVDPTANFLDAGGGAGSAQIYRFSIAADGSLIQLGPHMVNTSSFDCDDLSHSPDGKFAYATDDQEVVHAMAINNTTGVIAELSTSPYSPGAQGPIVVDLTGKLVYMGDEQNTGQVIGYTRDTTTGALTWIGNTSTANSDAQTVAIIH